MRLTIISLLLIISLFSFSQNRDSYFSYIVTESVYNYFDSLGIKRLDSFDTCDCGRSLEMKFWMTAKKKDAYDSLLLNEYADEVLIESITVDYLKYLIKLGKPEFEEVFIETNIIQRSNRFNIFRFKRKVRYKITLSVIYKPDL
jgi:hypothetical protein